MITIVKKILLNTANIARQLLIATVSISLVFQPIFYQSALANPSNIIPDGTTQTTIELSPNNVTVVNIASPTAGGTSMNNFDQFNVDQTGAIMNNSSIVVNTQIGGWIYANPHLANGNQASVIVGEVTSTAPSNLLGYTEIAGGKAEFVLLNPNGISCVGCGFINLSSLTLATGSGIYNTDGSLASVNMGAGNFSVSGAGLDASIVDYFRVISKNVQLSAPIWAKDELAIYQGSSNFNTTSNTFSGTANSQTGHTIGIDIAALGAMYAGKATLVASDLGLGVNIASDVIASNGGITITANGDIVYNNLTSSVNTEITANNGSNITQNGALSSGGNTNLTAGNNISIAGTSLASTGNTTITAGGNISNSNNLSLATNNLTTASTGNTTLQNLNATVSGQTNIAANNLSLTGSNIASTSGFTSNVTNTSNFSNTTVSSSSNVGLATKDLILQTAIISGNAINVNASNNITATDSKVGSQTSLLLQATSGITNSNSEIKGITGVTINSATLSNSVGTLINSNGALNVTSTSITNDASQIYSVGNLSLITNSLQNQNLSLIYSAGTLSINNTGNANLTSLVNTGSDIYSAGNLSLKANTLTNSASSLIQTGGTLNINSQTLTNQTTSQILATGNTSIISNTLNNTGNSLISTNGTLTETVSGAITQDSSQTLATGTIAINANSLTNQNSSTLQTNDALTLLLTSSLQNTGSSNIVSLLNTSLTTATATNSTNSNIISGGNFTGSFSSIFNNSANLLAFNAVTLNNLNNQNGYLEAGTSVLITNNNFGLNNSGGLIQSYNGNLTLASNYQFNNTSGELNSSNDINLNIKSNQNYTDTNSQINASGNIYLNSAGYDITEGSGVKFITSNLFQITAANFTNSSDIKVGYLDFNLSNALTNNANLVSTANSQYIIRRNIVNTGTIASGGTLLLQGANVTNTNVGGSTGLIYSAGNMEVAGSTSITNNANSAIVSGGTLGIYADTLITNGSNAQMWSVGNLTLAGYGNTSVATFNNGSTSGAAYLKSQANIQINAGQINNIGKDNASLTENNAYTVANVGYGGYPPMNSSKIMSQEVATNILTSTNSQIVAGGSMLINGNVLNQTGDILAGTNLTINGNVTNNITHFTTRSLSESWANTYEDCVFGAFGGVFCSTEHDWWSGSHTNTFSSLTPSRIAAGSNLTISGSQISNDSGTATFQNNTPLGGSSGGTNSGYSGSYATSFTNSNSLNSSNLASPTTNLNSLSNPALFTVNPNAPVLNLTNASGQNINFTYLYESNPAFNVQHNFLTSTYFFEHLDYNPSRQIILAADPYAERRMMEDTIAKTGMVQYLGNGAIDQLYASGLTYLEGRPTQVGFELTEEQIKALKQDVIIPVLKEINGQLVMTPEVYFSANTLNEIRQHDLAGGQIFAGGDLSFTATGNIVNKGFIGSGNKMTITADGDIVNTGGELNAGNNLILIGKNVLIDALTDQNNQVQNVSKLNVGANLLINATENISAYGASIKTISNANFTAGQNILLAYATSSSSMSAQGGDMSESKSKAVASALESGGSINMKSGGDFSVLAGQDTYSSHFAHTDDGALGTSASVTKDSSGLTNVSSIIKGNNVSIDSGNDATIVASNITATNNLSLESKGNTNILASKDMALSFSQETSSAGIIANSIDVSNHYNESVVSSNLTAGNSLLISSGKDVNILASNITGKDGNIVAGYYQDSNGVVTRSDGNVNVMSASEMATNYEYSKSTHLDPLGFEVALISGAMAGGISNPLTGVLQGAKAGAEVGENSQRGSEDINSDTTVKQVSSNLNFDNLNVISSKDINVQASNITTTNDTTLLAGKTFDDNGVLTNSSTDGLINILSATENQQSQSSYTNISPNYVALAMGGASAGAHSVTPMTMGGLFLKAMTGNNAESLERAYQGHSGTSDELQGGTQKSSILNAGGDLTLVATGDTNISASSLFGKNSVQISSENGNVNITSADETNKTTHETSQDVGTHFDAKADILKVNASTSVTVDTESHKQVDTSTTQKSSDIKSDGTILLTGNDITLISSNLTAGNIIVDAQNNFTTATKTDTHTTETYDTRSALIITAGVGNTYVDIVYNAITFAKLIKDLVSNPDEGKLEEGQTNSSEYERNQQINTTITAAKALLLGYATYRSAQMAIDAAGACGTSLCTGFYAYGSLTVESSSAKSTNTTSNERQNLITAGSLINLTAGTDANIYGSQLISGGDININAQNLTLEASKNNQTSGSSSVYDSVTGTAKTTGTFGGSFTHSESGSDLTATTNVASNIAGENVKINTTGDTNVLGSVIAGSNSVLIDTQNLNVTTLQDVLSATASSHSYTFGTDIGFSISSSSHDKLWAGTQAGIVSGDALNIAVADNTNLTGSLLNSQTGNMNLATNTLTHSNLQQSEKDWNYAYGLGVSFTVGGDKNTNGMNSDGSTNTSQTGKGSTTISASNSGFEKEGVAQATVGEGAITTGSDTSGLNRDETQSMLVTKNERTGGLDSSITVDNMLLTNPKAYMESVVSGFKKTTPQQVSKDIKEASGKEPSLGMGIFMKNENGDRVEPNTGIDTSEGKGDNMNPVLKYGASDRAPHLQFLSLFIPGFWSGSNTHDKALTPKKDENPYPSWMLPVTIPQYFYYNYYGALGTMLRSDVTAAGQAKPIQPLDK